MEIELKYQVPTKEMADNIWEDEFLTEISDPSSKESLVMKAVYFDTEDLLLSKNNIAVRVRAEGDHHFATLKANGTHKNGLFTRDEINVPVADDSSFISLDPKLFKGSDSGDKLISILGSKPLVNLIEMRFLRRRKRLSYGGAISELAVDIGSIITDKGEVPIQEVELELFAGEESALLALGEKLSAKYGLLPKETSKFRDGLSILGYK